MSVWGHLPSILYDGYRKVLHQGDRFVSWRNLFEYDWDLCIIVDACRFDLFQSVADEYSYIVNVGSITSADSMTPRWMERTFTKEQEETLSETVYVNANPFGEEWVNHSLLSEYIPVYDTHWDTDIGGVHPRPVTDAAIRVGRKNDSRLLVHYLQPHVPFIHWEDRTPLTKGNFRHDTDGRVDVWGRLRHGEVSLDEVVTAYRDNLQYVLDDIKLLVQNIDREVAVLTSDHGNGYGEWGIYGHPMHMPLSPLRQVPWTEISVYDSQDYTPPEKANGGEEVSRAEQLEALGYR